MNYQDFIKSIAQTASMSQKDAEQLTAALTAVMVNEIKQDNAIVLPHVQSQHEGLCGSAREQNHSL